MADTWQEHLALTHCGECGESERPLYWTGEGSPEDRQQWVCHGCLKKRAQSETPPVEASSDEPRFVLRCDRPEVFR